MAGLQTLLLEHNPEYARLSFGDPASSKGYEGKQGWSSWYSGDKFFVFKRHPKEENGFLYLDGSCNWLVRDLVQMKDESFPSWKTPTMVLFLPITTKTSFL